ncbi:MAG: replication initiation protein, partial [Lachnospiraceae bacterium]|nr:replication initiation protein [Lachnospiraceae bacterium]
PLNLTKKYSKRLYYLLKNKENFNGGVFVVSFSELRKMLKVPDSYANANVKKEILDKPYEEINGNTDISFEYELIQEKLPSGQKSLGAVRFKVKKVRRNHTIVEYETIEQNGDVVIASEEEQEIIDILGCSLKESRDILRTANANERTHEQLIHILEYTVDKDVENRVGYALTLLKNGFTEAATRRIAAANEKKAETKTRSVSKSSWNNNDLDIAYSQMDFDDLEKQLLSN